VTSDGRLMRGVSCQASDGMGGLMTRRVVAETGCIIGGMERRKNEGWRRGRQGSVGHLLGRKNEQLAVVKARGGCFHFAYISSPHTLLLPQRRLSRPEGKRAGGQDIGRAAS
jgi:hypothetical protein